MALCNFKLLRVNVFLQFHQRFALASIVSYSCAFSTLSPSPSPPPLLPFQSLSLSLCHPRSVLVVPSHPGQPHSLEVVQEWHFPPSCSSSFLISLIKFKDICMCLFIYGSLRLVGPTSKMWGILGHGEGHSFVPKLGRFLFGTEVRPNFRLKFGLKKIFCPNSGLKS